VKTGRPSIPTSLKLVKGTARKGRMKNEPKPQMEIPSVPPELSDAAKVEWGRISQDLFQLGLLSRIDRAALAVYCEAWSDWLDATEKVARLGKVIKTSEKVIQKADGTIEKSGGNFVENPYFSIKKRCAELMHTYLVEFGMSPASRTRINADPIPACSQSSGSGDRWSGLGG
jgi:P27 family predicted phage terminase small subunit